jgi:uncharacterized linocin/CFP29 family protein
MADTNSQLGWVEAQWNKVNSAVTEEFTKASVVEAFLPCYGPLAGSAETVKDEKLDLSTAGAIRVTDDRTLKVWTLTVNVDLSNQQVADESLSSALLAFRRAANKLAKVEDYIVLSGYALSTVRSQPSFTQSYLNPIAGVAPSDIDIIVTGGEDFAIGLTEEGDSHKPTGSTPPRQGTSFSPTTPARGQTIVTAVAQAIADLDASSHLGPFACVLGHDLFVDAHSPDASSLVLPADRITPMLTGPLLRSSSIEKNVGIVVSLSGDPIDLVVATPPKVQFLQVTGQAKFLFRVYERFVLRIKERSTPRDPGAVYTFSLSPRSVGGGGAGVSAANRANPGVGRQRRGSRKK